MSKIRNTGISSLYIYLINAQRKNLRKTCAVPVYGHVYIIIYGHNNMIKKPKKYRFFMI